jgi:Ser/Thr protein kinase RdoA (MazF antagonist)
MTKVAHRAFPPVDVPALLRKEYGWSAITVARIERGHTNASFLITLQDGRQAVLRQSWPGKPLAQVLLEEAMLAHLGRQADAPAVPRVIPTLEGLPRSLARVDAGSVACHLFEALPGQVRYEWHDTERLSRSPSDQRALADALASLHAALGRFPRAAATHPLARIRERLVELRGSCLPRGGHHPGPDGSHFHLDSSRLDLSLFCEEAALILARAESLPWSEAALQYCHGDFQLANVLFRGDEVSGIVDFDSLMFSARELDLAFALFSVSRKRDDSAFGWDEGLWHACLRHYGDAARELRVPPSRAFLDGAALPLLKKLFCLDQALLHLECARRGIWEIAEGIGFFSCFREVLSDGQ